MPFEPPAPGGRRHHVAVVGGGVAGLAAAWFLRERGGDRVRVTVLEASSRVGGKLASAEVGGLTVDAGAEAMLARRPEAVALARAVGLGADLVHPATTSAGVWTRGAVRPLPAGQVMGVPTDLRALAAGGVVSPRGVARAALDRFTPAKPLAGDVSLGRYVAARFGREVVDRLVDPLVGGVYAGHANRLSLAATVPQLAAAIRDGESLTAVGRRVRAAGAANGAPVFAGLRGGVGRLPAALAAAGGAEIRTGSTVRSLHRTTDGWRLVLGPTAAPEALDVDAVVLALPAVPAARLLAEAAPVAAAELGTIEYASVALVTLVLPGSALTRPLAGSGFLVPAVDGRFVKASTFSSAKWAWVGADAAAAVGAGAVVLRASVGRHGEEHDLQRDDADLVARVRADLATAAGVRGEPVGSLVTRWGGSLPQYAPGHLERIARVRAAVAAAPGLAVCGAAYDGVGIAACVASAGLAAEAILDALCAAGTMAS